MEVKIGKGIGEITFGVLPNAVKTIWGEPTAIKYTDILNGFYFEYAPQKTTLFFDCDENKRLFSIQTKNESVRFHKKAIIGKKEEEVIPFLKQFSSLTDENDYGYWKNYEFDEIGLSVSVRYGKIKCINLEPLWDRDIIWP